MDIIKAATDWAKAEMVSSIFFMLFGVVYLLVALVFWRLESTPLTKALVVPMLVVGALLLAAGISFYLSSKSIHANFESASPTPPLALIQAEITRTTQTIKTYENVALKVFPVIIGISLLIVIFISNPAIRAIGIAIIAFLSILVLLDSQALKRMKIYQYELELASKNLKH